MNKSHAAAAIAYSVITILAISVIIMFPFDIQFISQEITYTTSYENITTSDAKMLIENTTNITIADCTGGCQPCSWKNGKVPGATWVNNYEALYNSTDTLLVYTKDGTRSEDICKNLIGHVYGDIYNLVGGYNAWVDE